MQRLHRELEHLLERVNHLPERVKQMLQDQALLDDRHTEGDLWHLQEHLQALPIMWSTPWTRRTDWPPVLRRILFQPPGQALQPGVNNNRVTNLFPTNTIKEVR